MSNFKFDDDVEKILNEVENYDIDEAEEGNNESVDVDALLNEDLEEEQPEPVTLQDYGDPLNILEVPVAHQQEEKPTVENIVHPFEALEEKERDISAKLGGQQNLDSKFVVTNFERTMNKKFPNVTYEVLESISNHCFPSQYSESPEEENDYWGSPKCLAIIPEKYIAFGTSNAAAFVFSYETSDIKRFGTAKEQVFGAVTAIDVSLREEGLVCGHESGHIVLWGIARNEQIKVVNPTEKSPILSIKFWKETRGNVIASNAKGVVQLYTFTSSFFQWNVEKKVLINQSDTDKKPTGQADPLAHLPNGFLSIQVLRRDLTRHHPLNKYTVVALASMKMMIIITLEPVVGSVYKYMRPTGLSDLTVPSISWGKGALPGQDDNRHPLLAMSWGNDICILQCQSVEEEEGKGIKFGGYYSNINYEIFHLDWISESNLLIYDYTREFKILNVEKFNKNNATGGKNDLFDYSKAIVSSQPLDPDISFQVYSSERLDFGTRQRPIIYYTNTIVANQAARRVFVLGYKKMYVGRHFEWKEHIQDFVQKDEWLSAFGLFISIYKGENKTFAGLPIRAEERKEALKEYGSELVRHYIDAIHDKHGPPELTTINKVWKSTVFTIIDFLVSTENFSFLLKETKRIFENFGLQDLFMECLEAFILRNRIKSIPNEPFREIVKYYSERERIDVLQYLIINIDLEDIDIEFAITLCMEYNLLTALFYLCSHKKGEEGADFLTPIARAFSIYQQSEAEQENQEYGLKFLWFINMLLHGKLFPQGTIPEEIWQEKVKDIIILIFDEIHLDLMLRIDSYVAFEILRVFFEPRLTTIIESYDPNSIQLLADLDKLSTRSRQSDAASTELKYAADQFLGSINNKIQAEMLALIYYCGKKNKDGTSHRNLTYYTMAQLSIKYDYNIPTNVMQDCLFYILENERDLPKWERRSKKIEAEEEEEEEEIDILVEERNDLILGLMKKLEGKIKGEELKMIQKKMEKSEFLDVKAYLIALEGNYKACFKLYLDEPSTINQRKVFTWLNNLIRSVKSQDPTKLKSLKNAIFSEFCELVSIDNEKARHVILNLDPACETEAVATLKDSPRLQLNYLKEILEHQHKGYQVPDELLVLHMRLLCQLYPKEVLEEINKYAYPLDECLKLCREYNVSNGVAFFLERAGNLMEALNITLELFQKSLEKKLKKIEETSLFHEAGLTRKLQNAIEICRKNSRSGDSDSEKLWFRVLDKVIEGYLAHFVHNTAVQDAIKSNANNLKTDCYRRFAEIYSDYISNLFASISQNVSVDSIAAKLKDYQNLKLADLRQPLVMMLIAYYSENALVKETKNMVFHATIGKRKDLYNKKAQGVGTGGIDIDPDLVDKMIVFDCGHSFPRNYITNNQCSTCLEDESVQVRTLVYSIEKLKHRQKTLSGSREVSTASISPSQGSPREMATTNIETTITESTHEIVSAKLPTFDPKEKYLRKLEIVDHMMVDPSGHWEDTESIEQDIFNS